MPRNRYKPYPLGIASYQLTAGVDSKVHGLVLPPPKLQSCENAYIEQTGSIRRRYGRSALTMSDIPGNTITGLLASSTFQGRPLVFTSTPTLYDYSDADGRWTNRGRADSYRIRARQIDSGTPFTVPTGGALDMAILGNYRCYVFDYYTNATATNPVTAFTLTDSDGNVLSARRTLITGSGVNTSQVKVVAHGTRFYIFYVDTTASANLKCFIIDTTSASTINTSIAGSAVNTATDMAGPCFDVEEHLTQGPFLCYRTTTANTIKFGFVNTSGALTNTSTHTTTGSAAIIAVSTQGATTSYAIAYSNGSTPNDVFVTLKTFSSGVWATTSSSGAIQGGLGSFIRQIQVKWDPGSTTTARVFYTLIVTARVGVRQATYTTGGTATIGLTLIHSQMVARPFYNSSSETCYWVANEPEGSAVEPTIFLMNASNVLLGWANKGVELMPSVDRNCALGHVPNSGDSYSVLQNYLTEITSNELNNVGTGSAVAVRETIVDFLHDQSHVTVEDGSTLLVPSGALMQYDGQNVTELNFLAFVDTQSGRTTTSHTAGGGSLTSTAGTTYSYRIIPEATNAQGEREQGTDAGAITTTAFSLGDNQVTLTWDNIPWTRKTLYYGIYRAGPNPSEDSPFQRVGTVAATASETVSFTDQMSDANAALQEELRPDGELDNIPPPSGHIICSGLGRVFVAGFAEDPNLILYSKQRSHGVALAFNEALAISVPTNYGVITSLAVFAESLIIFCERGIYRVNGGGVNNTLTSGGFTDPVLVQADTGAIGHRGVVVTPMGVMYDAVKGTMLLSQGFAVQYIGAPLDQLTSPGTCTGAKLIPALQQVRFSYVNETRVYDYYHQQWYVFTHGSDGPTCIWNDVHAAISGDAFVYDSTGVYQDNGTDYTMELVLAWMHGSSLLSDLDVRKIGLTGQVLSNTYLTFWIAKDQEAVNQVIETTQSTTGGLSIQKRVTKQVLKQIEITIRDAIQNVYSQDVVLAGANLRLEELSFELALRSPRFGRPPGTVGGGGIGV